MKWVILYGINIFIKSSYKNNSTYIITIYREEEYLQTNIKNKQFNLMLVQ